MKYTDPSEFFKYIIEKANINVINDNQKCLSMALDLLVSDKPYFKLLKIAIANNAYKEITKAYNLDSNVKVHGIKKAINILTDECFIKEEKAIETVSWLASIIYPNEWQTFLSNSTSNEDNKKIGFEQPKPKSVITTENKNNIFEGKNWTLEEINLEMVYCPAGEFIMGSPAPVSDKANYNGLFTEDIVNGEFGRNENELQHQVILTKPFQIGKFLVTQKQYFAVMGEKPSFFKDDCNPVENVSWNDAKKFCERLNFLFKDKLPDGYKFSLPTEAQWEYSCRAGTTTSLNSGKNVTTEKGIDKNLDEIAWYCNNSKESTHPVGQKRPNSWGIFDMLGNVWELCEDLFGNYSKYSVTDPIKANNGSKIVIRGGGFNNKATDSRSARRKPFNPNDTKYNIGFRVALIPIINETDKNYPKEDTDIKNNYSDIQPKPIVIEENNDYNNYSYSSINVGENDSNSMTVYPNNQQKPTIITSCEEDDNSANNQNIIFEERNWTLEAINLEMIFCPAGSFMMGSPGGFLGLLGGELGRREDEIQHKVYLTKPFKIGKYPITQKQYKSIIDGNPSHFKGDNNPVESVSWKGAKEFCERLNQKFKDHIPKDYKFDLPSEAQWEYACRAGTTTALNNDTNLTTKDGFCPNLDAIAWYCKNSNNTTHPVGLKSPNRWNIYDMLGNVWEWCEDWYGDYPNYPIANQKSIISSNRVLRGGSADCNAWCCRSAYRSYNDPDRQTLNYNLKRDYFMGFRVALVPIY